MRKPLALLAAAAVAAAFAISAPTSAQATSPTAALENAINSLHVDDATKARYLDTVKTLPSDWQERAARFKAGLGVTGSSWNDLALSAIDPNDYQCADTTLTAWLDQRLEGADFGTILIVVLLGGLDVPAYDALLFKSGDDPQSYGENGEYTTTVTHELRDLKKFWDIKSDDIRGVAMHSDTLKDADRTARVLEVLWGLPAGEGKDLADLLIEVLAADPVLNADNPIFTFNAFAFTAEGDPDPIVQGIPDKIIMGDGIMKGMTSIGLGDVATRSILSHEFGHHVQFEDGLFDSPLTGPEATRRTELMADAFAGYFLTHKRGGTLNAKRLLPAVQSFFEVGDCAFDNNGHHGTPNQRLASSSWAVGLAQDEQKKGHIMPSRTFATLFDAQLPVIVKPDAH
ncbi:hypothetical protein [Microtetraspora niveoalba]|uniref:hypothetical protein n=1 Tax=Microtetraspora niveoalba TaxID=46175 RepID=UPI000833A9D3|nr:hypothetical protein [Microtetraspora niveoalba]